MSLNLTLTLTLLAIYLVIAALLLLSTAVYNAYLLEIADEEVTTQTLSRQYQLILLWPIILVSAVITYVVVVGFQQGKKLKALQEEDRDA